MILKVVLSIFVSSCFVLGAIASPNKPTFDCPKGIDCESGNILVSSDELASVYVNGVYSGKKTPAMLQLTSGKYDISVGTEFSRQYLKRSVLVDPESKSNVHLSAKDLVAPNVWKALFVGVPEVYEKKSGKHCSTKFNEDELDSAYRFLQQNLNEQIEPYSYGTVKWQLDRQDLTKPVELTHIKSNGWYTLEASEGLAELDRVQPGEYDIVFFFWREEQGECSFKSSYFGLAWLEPTSSDTRKTGYVTIKFNIGEAGIDAKIAEYLTNDPGVWTHEWLHVVVEKFYPNLGVKLPFTRDNQLILHAAGDYQYKYPWLQWYQDLISGQIPLGNTYVGIGPEALLTCSIRQQVLGQCRNK